MYKFFHIYVQGEATSFISSTTILKLLLAGILMSEIVMRKLDLTDSAKIRKVGISALRLTKIVYNIDLFVCNRVNKDFTTVFVIQEGIAVED